MTEDAAPPPTPLPPAAQSPYPAHPAPQPHHDTPAKAKAEPESTVALPAIGPLGLTLIGGAVAAAVGLLVVPLFRRKPAKPARKRAARNSTAPRTRRKRSAPKD